MFEVLKKHLPIKQEKVEDWLSLKAEERRKWIDQADLRTSAALLLLEQASFRQQLVLAQDEVKQRYLGARELNNGGMDKANATLQQILANSGFLSRPAELLGTGGYGLPQPNEWTRLESESSLRQKQLHALTGDLDKEVRALLEPSRAAEMAANEANLKQVGEHLRKLHKAAGGLELP
jgi:multidrug efflux pump subunit AcrA (membrane-fusion protein)